jgi:transcriptional regulator of acetoin/glycerol metabolism
MRPEIEASWRRSSACGLAAGTRIAVPFDPDIETDSRLVRAAGPVLDRLSETLADTSTSLLLADRTGRLLERRVGQRTLINALDRADVAPGFGYSEESAGTNGVGTALESASVVLVHGAEHFADHLRNLACVGIPIHDPITRRVEGVLDFTCKARDYHPMAMATLVEAGKHIEARLTQLASPAEVALLEAFIRACRIHRGAVVGVRSNMLLTNPVAVRHLTPDDQAVLFNLAKDLTSEGRLEGALQLSEGEFRVRCTEIVTAREPREGVILRIEPATPRQATRVSSKRDDRSPPLPGRSALWRSTVSRLRRLGESLDPVVVVGETGTGKLHLAYYLIGLSSTAGEPALFDCAELAAQQFPEYQVRAVLAAGGAVVLSRIDLLTVSQLAQLRSSVAHARSPETTGRLVATCRTGDDGPGGIEDVLAAFTHEVVAPPLRLRPDDIADLVPFIVRSMSDGRSTCSLAAMQVLMRYPWAGNVTELRDVLRAAIAAGTGREVQVAHLPTRVQKRSQRRQLSPLECAERDLIIETLSSVSDNRTDAARVLGIGRATLYRRMRYLDIVTEREVR